MTDVLDILRSLRSKKIEIKLKDNDLSVQAPKGALTKELVEMIRDNKQRIIKFLTNTGQQKDKYFSIEPAEYKDHYLLSSAQKRLYILTEMEPGNIIYNMPLKTGISGHAVSDIKIALKTLLDRHESLRTSFKMVNDQPAQIIHDNVELDIEIFSASDENEAEKIFTGFVRPFDLGKAPLIRTGIIEMEDGRKYLITDMHHIISDGVSIEILSGDLVRLLAKEQLPPLRLQYRDYAEWQNSSGQQESVKAQEKFWLDMYSDEIPVLDLPYDHPRPFQQSYEGKSVSYMIESSLAGRIDDICRKSEVTLSTFLLSVYGLLLSKLSGNKDIVVGIAVAGRRHSDLAGIIGMFVNTLAVRYRIDGSLTFSEYLKSVNERTLSAYENQEYQFEDLVEHLNIVRDAGRNPLFDVMFNVLNMGEGKYGSDMDGHGKHTDSVAKFDLTLNVIERNDSIELNVNYCSRLFEEKTIDGFFGYFIRILEEIDLVRKLSGIEILSPEERSYLIHELNDTKADYPKDKTVYELFAQTVRKYPERTALVFDGNGMSYRELDERSNRLARKLRELGVKRNDIVGIMTDRSFEMIIGILGILKSGCGYMPIDPAYPSERRLYMCDDSGTKVLLSTGKIYKEFGYKSTVLMMDEDSSYSVDPGPLEKTNEPSDLCYVIYTSGTTGKPKGTMISHRSLINLCWWHNKEFGVTENDIATLYAGVGFDASVWELFPYILKGSQLHVIPENIRMNAEEINRYYENNGISISFLPTQVCEQFVKYDNNSLRILLTGADKLNYFEKRKYDLINNYGPTENTVVTTSFLVGKDYNNIPIGRPISNTQVYIVDGDLRLQPVKSAGEILIGGDSIADGYLNRPELTKNKFIWWDPETGMKYDCREKPSGTVRVYRSGDRGRILEDGNIEFLGRIDTQVKIRGFRIETGEIENNLLNTDGVKEVAVIARDAGNGDKYLCAYIVKDKEIDNKYLRQNLSENLPDYMIPSHFVFLDSIPLTSNGKIDRRSLPAPDIPAKKYIAPRNETETKLAGIWSDVLGVDKEMISIDSNFFDLGGHSLKATVLMSRVHKEFDVRLSLAELFRYPEIGFTADIIMNLRKDKHYAIEKAPVLERYRVSSAQKRLYFLYLMDPGNTVYNMPQKIDVSGYDPDDIEKAVENLIERHESLRTSFELYEDEPFQIIHEKAFIRLEKFEAADEIAADEIFNSFIRPFDLTNVPVLRTAVILMPDGKKFLLIDMHHIISDGVSMDILRKDFLKFLSGEGPEPLILQYKDYSEWQNSTAQKEAMGRQRDFWTEIYKSEIPVLELPYDHPRPVTQSFEGASVNYKIESKLTSKLRDVCKANSVTLSMLLLSAFNILLSKLSGQEDIIVGIPTAGRRHADLEKIMGMFVNTLAVRNFPEHKAGFEVFLSGLKERTLAAYDNQEYQFEDLLEYLKIERDPGRNPLFDVMFNVLNISDEQLMSDVTEYGIHTESSSKFDLTLNLIERDDIIDLNISYCTGLFESWTIDRFMQYYLNILSGIAPGKRIKDIDMLSFSEKNRILNEFNDTKTDFPDDKMIHELFEEQAEKDPDAIALIFGDEKMSYGELNFLADRIAVKLKNNGAGRDVIIGIMADRSFEMITGLLGIMKSGAAYLPLDPDNPAERTNYMIEDASVDILVTQEKYRNSSASGKVQRVIYLNDMDTDIECDTVPRPAGKPEDLAYVIYTSGTTGKPKGVPVQHKGVVNTLSNRKKEYDLSSSDTELQLFHYTFDGFVTSFFTPLISGARIVLVRKEDISDVNRLGNIISENSVTSFIAVPPLFRMILENASYDKFRSLRSVTLAGDVVSQNLLELCSEKLGNVEINIEYGVTEASVMSTIARDQKAGGTITIGRPAGNNRIYILGIDNMVQPTGVKGEICIAGAGLARGYLKRPELTEEKFIWWEPETGMQYEDSSERPDAVRLYRSGDSGRLLPDGRIEFLGRIDDQVKIRGFRIELGEIESSLLNIPGIQECVVAARTRDGENYLAAYVVTNTVIDPGKIRDELSGSLPEYMIPAFYVRLDSIPLTYNGKIDRRSLPEPEVTVREYVAPGDEQEEKLVEIWSEALNLEKEKISTESNFFELGGHSLKIIKIKNLIQERMNADIDIVDFFKYTTIRSLIQFIREGEDCSGIADRDTSIKKGRERMKNQRSRRESKGRVEDEQ